MTISCKRSYIWVYTIFTLLLLKGLVEPSLDLDELLFTRLLDWTVVGQIQVVLLKLVTTGKGISTHDHKYQYFEQFHIWFIVMIEKFDKSFNLFIFNWFPCLRKKFSQLVVVLYRCIGTINFLRRTINFLVAILWPSASYLNNFITSWIFEREKCLSDTVSLAGWITGWINIILPFASRSFLFFMFELPPHVWSELRFQFSAHFRLIS